MKKGNQVKKEKKLEHNVPIKAKEALPFDNVTILSKEKQDFLKDYWKQYHSQAHDTLDRTNLYDSAPAIKSRNWDALLAAPEDMTPERLKVLYREYIDGTKSPEGPAVPPEIHVLRERIPEDRPLMFCEYGFGNTTFLTLDWCLKNNGYLVTVEMPICPASKLETDQSLELFYWGVDRYWRKHDYCLKLQKEAAKRWLWINDDMYKVSYQIETDEAYRKTLFLNGKIDFFVEDAIHEQIYSEDLYRRMKPFLSEGSCFYAYQTIRV